MTRKTAQKTNTGLLLAFALLGAMAIPAAAQEAPATAEEGCSGFGWPMATEIAWMSAQDLETFDSGAKMPAPPAKAIAVKLKPSKDVTLPVKSGMKKQAVGPASFSGWMEIASLPKAGLYQISLSHEGWIDAVQNGESVLSHGFTGKKGCKAVHKSVRYELGAGPLTVQISGAPTETVTLAIRELN